jgi:hypothetical protein
MTQDQTMNYAKALTRPKACVASDEIRMSAFAGAVRALWGDYGLKDCDMTKEELLESANKRKRWAAAALAENKRTPEQIQAEQDRFQEKVTLRLKLQAMARAKELLRPWVRKTVKKIRESAELRRSKYYRLNACKCGCGRLEHSKPPRADIVGFCCGWCAKHGGGKGHGDACEAISSTTFLRIST